VTHPQRPLAGCVVNLSVSESDDSTQRGFPSSQVNRVTLQIVSALFGQGASLVFGHDWRDNGVMEAVYGFARQVQSPIPLSRAQADAENEPLLRNLVPWPDKPYLSGPELEQLSSTLRVELAGLPRELEPFEAEARRADPNNTMFRYIRARGLTFLRRRLNDTSHVRFCIGGRRSGYAGRYPGVIEEAFLAVTHNKPLYLAGVLGGATNQVLDAFEGREMADDFCHTSPLEALYAAPPAKETDLATRTDRVIDRIAVWKAFRETGRERLARNNGLTVEENNELFHTSVIERAIELVLIGLSRLQHAKNNRD
jgi:hypothetical protein